jgi:tRNA threonylcarbamoyladenosine biosynthesis protein TsaB
MIILTIRTDKPEAELGLYDDSKQLAYTTWLAHRELSETIHLRLRDILVAQHKELHDLQGIVFFQGPGSFTGLRIGASVVNALGEGVRAAIIGSVGEDWIQQGINRLLAGEADPLAIPEYGAAPNITAPRK